MEEKEKCEQLSYYKSPLQKCQKNKGEEKSGNLCLTAKGKPIFSLCPYGKKKNLKIIIAEFCRKREEKRAIF